MKQICVLSLLLLTTMFSYAQGKEKEKTKGKEKQEMKKQKKQDNEQDGQQGNGNSKIRKNIPTKVRQSFNADYPGAVNDIWTKNRGDWTVTFTNNVFRSTATYHSNGDRIDTRTPMNQQQTPRPVLDEILKRYPQSNPKDIIKIEKPKNPNLFQVIVEAAGKKKTLLLNEQGKIVSEQ